VDIARLIDIIQRTTGVDWQSAHKAAVAIVGELHDARDGKEALRQCQSTG